MSIIQAFLEGKTIERKTRSWEFNKGWRDETQWEETEELIFRDTFVYRIKPEPKPSYRPFANAEECWQEMKKHQPFGVVKDKHFANYQTHRAFTFLTTEGCNFRGYEDMTFETSFKNLLFADGTPFGVKVEEQLWKLMKKQMK